MHAIKLDENIEAAANSLPLARIAKAGVSVATFAGFDSDGKFLVSVSEGQEPVTALSTVGLAVSDVGAEIAIAFDKGNVRWPIIIGRIQERAAPHSPSFKLDGERVVLNAERDIELRCGDASILLTRAGKVLIRGNYVLTRSRGANKIKGASVDIN